MLFGKHVNGFYLKYFLHFIIGIIALIVVDFAQLKVPELLGLAMDNIKNGVDPSTYLSSMIIQLVFVAIAMLFGRFIWRVALFGVATKIQADLRRKIFYKTTKLSRNQFAENKVGELMSLMTYDVETVQDMFGFGMISLVDFLFLGGLTLYKMFTLDWRLSLFSMVPLLLIAILSGVIEKGMSVRYENRQKKLDDLSSFAQENFSGIRVIKACIQEAYEHTEAVRLGMECRKADVSLTKFSAGVDSIISFLCSTIIVLILGVGGYFIYLGSIGQMEAVLSSGAIITFVGYFSTLVWPMMALGTFIVMHSKAKTSLKRISTLLDLKEDIHDGDKELTLPVKGEIEIKDFTFFYENEKYPALKNISLHILSGEKIGIVGRIGSGKTTLSDILLRLYDIEKNKVFIDGQDIMELKIKDVHEIIGYVPQDSFLFSDKVRNNIAFYDEEVPFERIDHAAEFSDVKENILGFSQGYDTLTGERGVSLSGGQKQRIAISRAAIKDAPILIFDDSVSAVDMKTEKTILENIQKEREGKTTIIIASRVSTVENLDRILVLNDGEVEGFDKHEVLYEKSPLYRKMVAVQKIEDSMEGRNRYE